MSLTPPLSSGPGLAIRVLCQSEAYLGEDFSLTTSLLAHIVDFCRASQQPSPTVQSMQECMSPQEQDFLQRVTLEGSLAATLLPIFSVGVQVSWAAGADVLSLSLVPRLHPLAFIHRCDKSCGVEPGSKASWHVFANGLLGDHMLQFVS